MITATSGVRANWSVTSNGAIAFNSEPVISGVVASDNMITIEDAVTYEATVTVTASSVAEVAGNVSGLVWPSSLPQEPLTGTWGRQPKPNVVSFTPDVGPSINRRRGSAKTHMCRGTFQLIEAQRALFEEFYEDILADGVLSYDWNDPEGGAIRRWRISDYSMDHVGTGPEGKIYRLGVNLERQP